MIFDAAGPAAALTAAPVSSQKHFARGPDRSLIHAPGLDASGLSHLVLGDGTAGVIFPS
jgi:hypothetical protein